jgi:hypothetical protein
MVTKHISHGTSSSVSAVDGEKTNWYIFQLQHSYYKIRKCARFQFSYIIAKYNALPLLTQMEDDSNLRQPLEKHVCQEKMYFSKSKMTPQKQNVC